MSHKPKSGANLDIIGCQNCSTVLQRCVVPGRVWTDKGGDQPVDQGALATIRNAHHSHPQTLPVFPKTTSSAHNLRVLKRVACRLPHLWKLFESLQDLPSLLSLTGTRCWKEEIPCGADARSDIEWRVHSSECCGEHVCSGKCFQVKQILSQRFFWD